MSGSLLCYIINSFCCLLYKKDYKNYVQCRSIEEAQEGKLMELIRQNGNTSYGSRYNFKNIHTIADFQRFVPLTVYEDYLPYIEKIKNGETNILTRDSVLLLEPTSGSVTSSKLIPYTAQLKKEFQKGIKPWIYNLYTSYPKTKWGKSYWSVTPAATKKEYTKCGTSIGFEEDSQYFGALEQYLMKLIFAAPGSLAKETDIEVFYFKTVLSLLKCKNLTLISIWSPTFMFLILDYLDMHKEAILEALPPRRRREIEEYIKEKNYHDIWKKLRIISCWCDANAAIYIEDLQRLFPKAAIQPKGLLATEGFVSFPFAKEEGCRLSYYSHFFEFLSSRDKKIYLAHQLGQNERYEVILTTGSGLYRYCIKDIIEVIGFADNTPLIRFIGKSDNISDLFGEKLNELFIKSVMDELGLKDTFYMVAPEGKGYVLYIKTVKNLPDIDKLFCTNFHYAYCRKLGQLNPLRIYLLEGSCEQEYIEQCVKMGQRMGDVKLTVLSLVGGWDKVFTGRYIR